MWPRRREERLTVGLTLLLLLAPAVLPAQGAYLEGGLSLTTGDYVYTQRTSGGAASVGLAWSKGRLTLRATLPWFVHDTRSLTVAGAEPAEPALDGAVPSSEQNGYVASLGDPFFQLYVAAVRTARTSVGLGFSMKAPVLEAGDFGTGGWDFGGSGSLSRSVGASTLLGFDGSYWHLADPPGLELRDTVLGTVTVARAFGPRWSASLSLSGGRSAVAGYADPWWCGMLLGRSFSRGIWGITATVGLSETAPDFGVGLIWRLRVQ